MKKVGQIRLSDLTLGVCLFQVPGQRAVCGTQTFGYALRVELRTLERGVRVVAVIISFGAFLAYPVEGIGRDVVQVHELYGGLGHYLPIPFAVTVVAAFYLSAGPFVAGREGHQNRRGTFFAHVVDEFFQVPSEGVNDFVVNFISFVDPVNMTGILRAGNDTASLAPVDVTDVVMAELYQHEVARLKGVVDTFPAVFFQISACAPSGFGFVRHGDFVRVEDGSRLTAPTPHAIRVFVLVLYGGISRDEDHGFAFLAFHLRGGRFEVRQASLQGFQRGVRGSGQFFGGRTGVQACAERTGVDAVPIEVVIHLPCREPVVFRGRYFVQVYEGYALLFGHLPRPKPEGSVHACDVPGAFRVPCVAGREREQDGVCAQSFAFTDETAQVFAVAVDGFLLTRLLDGHTERVRGADAADGSPCAAAVERTIVIVPQFDDDVVSLADTFLHVRPKLAVERAAARAAQGMVFHGQLVRVEIFVGEIPPAPLAVVAVAFRAGAHRGVAHEEEHGVVALSRRTGHGACRVGFFQAVECEVRDVVHVLHRAEVFGVLGVSR